MDVSPAKLQDLCIECIAKNVKTIFKIIKDMRSGSSSLPAIVAEPLLQAFDRKGFTDSLLYFFHPSRVRLNRVRIKNARKLTYNGLKVLRLHKLVELEVVGLQSANVNDLIGCLGEWSLLNLQILSVSGSTFLNRDKVRVVIALSKLRSLRSLDVSFTEFNSRDLEIVAEDLPCLRALNISRTMVADISALKKCGNRLQSLVMYNLSMTLGSRFVRALTTLEALRHLDVSGDSDPYDLHKMNCVEMSEFLKQPQSLPNLVSLDISGKKGLEWDAVKMFLSYHKEMKFLGLMENELCEYNQFCNQEDLSYNPKLVVSGYSTEPQVLESLRRYFNRKAFLQKSLCYLYNDIQDMENYRVDILALVLNGMSEFPDHLGIQLAATACLFNLTKNQVSHTIHVAWLKKVILSTLKAMCTFPKQQQLQKNALLTLCSDRMLQDVEFDRYNCAQLVMNSLMRFEDPAMNRMSVAICSILAARITTNETSNLGSRYPYMRRLLNIIENKTKQNELDIMMKFTLSALWNLTDESPKTCNVFLGAGGLQLFLNVLDTFSGESSIETKVLGLINNIAEVSELRHLLMDDEFMKALERLLFSQHIDVSYFAAGIIAHLASEGETSWKCKKLTWQEMAQKLGEAVMNWNVPDTEMVAYRSFFPFYQLLFFFDAYQVQLWAVWAIHHVCLKNPKRYCKMIVDENGFEFLVSILNSVNPILNEVVATTTLEILQIIKKEYPNMELIVRGNPIY